MTLTRVVLDKMGCATPFCGHDHSILYLHAQCHPRAKLDARYVKDDGVLILTCAVCQKETARVAVENA